MLKLTDLINQLSSEIALTRISNDEFRKIQEILLEMRIEARRMAQSGNTITLKGSTTNIAVDWPSGSTTYNNSDVVV